MFIQQKYETNVYEKKTEKQQTWVGTTLTTFDWLNIILEMKHCSYTYSGPFFGLTLKFNLLSQIGFQQTSDMSVLCKIKAAKSFYIPTLFIPFQSKKRRAWRFYSPCIWCPRRPTSHHVVDKLLSCDLEGLHQMHATWISRPTNAY